MSIKFIQYLRPNGKKRSVLINRSPEVENRARLIALLGYRFEIEELSDGMVNMTITNIDGDVAGRLVQNGPDVPSTVDDLIMNFEISN